MSKPCTPDDLPKEKLVIVHGYVKLLGGGWWDWHRNMSGSHRRCPARKSSRIIDQWIAFRENLNRKPWLLPSKKGVFSCTCSHHPILWIYGDFPAMSSSRLFSPVHSSFDAVDFFPVSSRCSAWIERTSQGTREESFLENIWGIIFHFWETIFPQSSSIVQVALLAAQSQRHALPDFPHIPDMPHTSGLLHTPQLCLGGKWSNEKGKWLGAAMYLRHIFANVRGLGKHLGMGPVWVKLGTPSIW